MCVCKLQYCVGVWEDLQTDRCATKRMFFFFFLTLAQLWTTNSFPVSDCKYLKTGATFCSCCGENIQRKQLELSRAGNSNTTTCAHWGVIRTVRASRPRSTSSLLSGLYSLRLLSVPQNEVWRLVHTVSVFQICGEITNVSHRWSQEYIKLRCW